MNAFKVCCKLYEDIERTVTEKLKNIRYDKTFKATVTQKVNNTVYKVACKKAEYKVKSDYNLSIDDVVWVCAPENNWDSLFVVSHKSNSLKNYEFREDGIYLDGVKITK